MADVVENVTISDRAGHSTAAQLVEDEGISYRPLRGNMARLNQSENIPNQAVSQYTQVRFEEQESVSKGAVAVGPRTFENYGRVSNQAGNQYIQGDIKFYVPTSSLFSSLVLQHDVPKIPKLIMANKSQHRARRQAIEDLTSSSVVLSARNYAPYAKVTNRNVRRSLFKIAERFQFLDRGFAEYFRVVGPFFDRDTVRDALQRARKSIEIRAAPDRHQSPDTVYLGDLGQYCELIFAGWTSSSDDPNTPFNVTHKRDEIIDNLQDAFEVPYWELIADLFLETRLNTLNGKSLSTEVVLRVLDSLTTALQDDLHRLKMNDKKDIPQPVLDGIDARLKVLRAILDSTSSEADGKDEFLSSVFEKEQPDYQNTKNEIAVMPSNELENNMTETVFLIGLSFIFLAIAIVPGYKAFSISMNVTPPSNGAGSTSDADFWYLIQSSVMTVLGNFISVVPLLKKSWLSPAYSMMWIFFSLGLASAIISISIYPFINTGWSAISSFLGSVASIASVLVLTQATGKAPGR